MRTTSLLTAGILLTLLAQRTAASEPTPRSGAPDVSSELVFGETVRPFLASYCLECHTGTKPKGDLDLSAYTSPQSVGRDLAHWELVLEQLESKTMPPRKAKRQPPAEARGAVIEWVRSVRKREAARNAGDPGPVPPRRLSNAEYDYTVRDLTGVDIRPTHDFPVDPANEAGFDNSAESLAMSPALVKKYLGAAKLVAEHVVFLPQGIAFAPHPVVADTDRDKYCVRRVIDFYKRQRTDYADFFHAAWRFKHREALESGRASLADEATRAGISPGYLATVWTVLNEPAGEVGPIAALQSIWRDLPRPAKGSPPPSGRVASECATSSSNCDGCSRRRSETSPSRA